MFSPGQADRLTMKDGKDKGEGQAAAADKKAPAKDPRQDRLKQALRENLKRRKSQARGRSDVRRGSSDRDDVSPHDVSGKKPGP
jgi:uncharacterized protein involved in type VI secretion and phage assembly